MRFVFGDFRLDTANQCLLSGTQRLALTPKAFNVLRYMVENPGRLVTHEELLEALWPETYVQPEVLRKYILEIRKVLKDPPKEGQFVATFPKRGYEFVFPVTREHETMLSGESAGPSALIVGRKPALAQLNGHLAEAMRGNRQVVFVTGEAGIGKTTLVDAFVQQIGRYPQARVIRGQCVEGFGGKEAYFPLLEALSRSVRGQEKVFVIETLAARAPTWLVQFSAFVQPERLETLRQEVLGATRERMVREICEVLELLTSEHVLVLVLEDLHWVDYSTLDVISAVARRREGAKLLLLATYRPVDVILSGSPLKLLKQDLLVHQLCHEVRLERFGDADITEYLNAKFPDNELPGGLAAVIQRHSDGNALFMVSIIDDLLKRGLIANHFGRWELTQSLDRLEPGVPETLQEMMGIAFDRLGAEEQHILRCASVVGERFSAWAIGSTLGADVTQVEACCEPLVRREQFIRTGGNDQAGYGPSSAQYEFRHTLFRDFLYKRLSASERWTLHRTLAERIEAWRLPGAPVLASELAFHFEEGRDYDRAIRYLVLTSENLSRRYALNDAIQVLHHALELVPNLLPEYRAERELQILQNIGDAHYTLGDMLQSAEVYATMSRLAEQNSFGVGLVNALVREASAASFFDSDRCIAVSERAVQVSAHVDSVELQACAQLLAPSWRIAFNGWTKEDGVCYAAAMEKVRSLGDRDLSAGDRILYAQILGAQFQCVQSDFQGALRGGDASRSGLENRTSWEYLSSYVAKALAHMGLGQLGEANRHLQKGMESAEKAGNPTWTRVFRSALAHFRYLAFDYETALRESVILKEDGYVAEGQAWTLAAITAGLSALELGRLQQALHHFEEVRNLEVKPRSFLDWYWRMLGLYGSSRAWLAARNLPNASRDAELFLEATLSCADRPLQALAWTVKAQVVGLERGWEDARDSIEKALLAMKDFEAPISAWRVHTVVAEFCLATKDDKAAKYHRARAKELIAGLADSFEQLTCPGNWT